MATVSGNPHALLDEKDFVSEDEVSIMKREDLRNVLYQLTGQLVKTAFESREAQNNQKENISTNVKIDSNLEDIESNGGTDVTSKLKSMESTITSTVNEHEMEQEKFCMDENDMRPDGICSKEFDNLVNGFHDENGGSLDSEIEKLSGKRSLVVKRYGDNGSTCMTQLQDFIEDKNQNEGSTFALPGSRYPHGGNGYHNAINLLEIFRKSNNIAQLTSELQNNLSNFANMNIHFDRYLDFAFALNRLCRFVLSVIEKCSEDDVVMDKAKCHDTSWSARVDGDDTAENIVDASEESIESKVDLKEADEYQSKKNVTSSTCGSEKQSRKFPCAKSLDISTQTDLLYQDYVNLLSVEEDIYEEMQLLKSEAEILREENKDLCDINDALRSRIELISQNNEELLRNQDELLNEISRQREENQTLRNNFNRVLYDYNRLENEMQSLQFDYEDLNIEKELLSNRLSLKDQECKSLRDRHDTTVKKMKVLQEKFDSVKNMHDESKVMKRKDWEEWSKLRSQLSATENALQDVRRQKSKLIRDLEQMRERLRRNQNEVSKADEAAMKLEERISRAKRCRDKEILLDRERQRENADGEKQPTNVREKRVRSSYYYKVKSSDAVEDDRAGKVLVVRKGNTSTRVKNIIRALTSEGSDEGDEGSSDSPVDENGDFLFWGLSNRRSPAECDNTLPSAAKADEDSEEGDNEDEDVDDIDKCDGYNIDEYCHVETSALENTSECIEADSSTIKEDTKERLGNKGSLKETRAQSRQSCVSSIRLDLYTVEESE